MNAGGAETFLMKIYRAIDKDRYQMDFYIMSEDKGYYEDEIRSLEGKIYHSIPKSKNFFKAFITLMKTVKKEKYKYVFRASQHSLAALDLLAAKLGGAKILVQRSTNSDSSNRISRILHKIFQPLSILLPNVKIAPSTKAAEYTFGKRCVKNNKVTIINNAIPTEDFTFDLRRRDKIRRELQIENKFVVGHVGRFSQQKNHSFLIDVFLDIYKKNNNSVLVLVGEGELENEIKEKIEAYNLTNNVVFTGVRSDIPDLMMAMDVFVFPSFYEGMPNVVIEAQATGLPCIISDSITQEVAISELVTFLSIKDSPGKWANKSLNYRDNFERKNMKLCIVESGYDIEDVTRKFAKVVFENER